MFSWFSELIRFIKFQTDILTGTEMSSDSILPHDWVLSDQLRPVSLDAVFLMDATDVF